MNAASNSARFARLNAWRAQWNKLAPRERHALLLAAATLGAGLLWWVLLAPALQTLRQAPAQHAALDQQLLRMQRLQSEARRLQADMPAPLPGAQEGLATPADLPTRLRESVQLTLGAGAQVTLQGERALLTLKGVPASALAAWLGQARQNLRVNPLEMRLTAASAPASPASAGNRPAPANARPAAQTDERRWDGSLVLGLPQSGAAP